MRTQVTSRVARKWIGLADAGEWGRAWLPAQAPGQSRTMGGCEQFFSASVASPLSKTASLFSRTITPLTSGRRGGRGVASDGVSARRAGSVATGVAADVAFDVAGARKA